MFSPESFHRSTIGVNHLHLSLGRRRNPARAWIGFVYFIHSQSVIISCVSINEASKSPIKKPHSNCFSAKLRRMKQKSCFFGESPKMMTDFRACCELIISIHKKQKCAQKKLQSIGLLAVYRKSFCKQMWLGFLFFDFLSSWPSVKTFNAGKNRRFAVKGKSLFIDWLAWSLIVDSDSFFV